MPRLLVALLMLPFLIGCSEKPKPEILELPQSTTDAQLAEKLKGLTKLKKLDLRFTQITDAGLAHLKGLTKLEELHLGYNTNTTDAGLAHLKGLTKLEGLFLSETNITDAGLVHLKGLTKLEFLNLWNTNITDAGENDLKKALPDCSIIKQ